MLKKILIHLPTQFQIYIILLLMPKLELNIITTIKLGKLSMSSLLPEPKSFVQLASQISLIFSNK